MPRTIVNVGPNGHDKKTTRLTSVMVVGWCHLRGVGVYELVPRRVQEGAFLVTGLVGVPHGRGVGVPVLGSAWAGDQGLQVEGVGVRSPEVRELLVDGRMAEVHAGKVVVVEGRHL